MDRGLFNELDLYNQTGLGIILHMPIVFLSTKIGQIEALIKNGAVAGVLIGDNSKSTDTPTDSSHISLTQLQKYFAGKLGQFDLPLVLVGTDFQKSVWRALQEIPYGETRTYQEVAKMIGRPKAYRAVANAVGANPVPIIIPCHRVVRSDGSLGGYSAGVGVATKKWLLDFEKSNTKL